MSRHAIRKQVFLLLFRTEFHNAEEMPEQERLFFLQDDIEDTYKGTDIWAEEEEEPDKDEKRLDDESEKEVSERFHAIQEALPEIDKELNEKMSGWSTERLGKVELTILRIALYEMRKDDTISDAVAINEAVELAKKYGQEKSGEFVNGVLAKLV